MEYVAINDSSGTNDGYPPETRGRVLFSANGRSVAGAFSQPRTYSKLDSDIHQIEQQAYTGVLRAFKMQSDDITWEKESLITELRRELKVSDEEHRVLLNKVNEEEAVHRIRQSRQGGGTQSGLHCGSLILPSLGPFKRQKTAHSTQSPIMPLHAMSGNKADMMASEDIRWGSANQVFPNRGGWRPADGAMLGAGRRSGRFHVNGDYVLSNGFGAMDFNRIGIPNTSNIVKEVERVLSHPDMYEIEKAKKLLRDHEQSLLDAIARLDDASDGESEDVMPIEGSLGTAVV